MSPRRTTNWHLVIEYLLAHPEGVTGAQLLKTFHIWQVQSNATLRKLIKAQGFELVGEPLPGPATQGNPKCYKLKRI